MKDNYTFISIHTQYGATVDSKQLYFLTVISPNNHQIRLGYQNPHITIEELINQYKDLCSQPIYNKAHFRFIQQGPLDNTIALYEDQLSSLSLNFDEYCFRVEDLSSIEQKQEIDKAKKNRKEKFSKNFIEAIVRYHPEQKIMKVDLQKSLSDFKKQIIEKFEALKKVSPVNIKINCKGLFINEKISKMSDAKLEDKSEINIIVKKQNGCFGKHSSVLLQNYKQCKISQIKTGQKVMSYNHERDLFQVDQVTSIIKCNLDFYVTLKFEDGTSIDTTINHPFLCQDKKYRKIQKQDGLDDSLQIGSLVCRKDGKNIRLIAIQQKYQSSSQQFFHLCIVKNHNFIINGIIVHNPTVKVQLPNQQAQIVNIDPTQPLEAIKKHIQRQYGINSHNIQLTFAGKLIKDFETMADKNIGKDSTIYLIYRPSQEFNYIQQSMNILLSNKKYIPLQQLDIKTQIAVYDWNQNNLAYKGEIPSVVDAQRKQWMIICLDSYENKIIVSPQTFMQIQNGQVMCAKDLCYKYKVCEWPKLRKIDGQLYKIVQIAHYCESYTKSFKRIQLSQFHSYSINKVIVHNKFTNILFKRNNQQDIKLSFPIFESFKVQKIKSMVSQALQIDIKAIALTFQGNILEDDKHLFQYGNLGPQHIIVANSIKSVKDSKLISKFKAINHENLEVVLQISRTQNYPIQYTDYKDKKIEEIMNKYYPKCKGSYFFAYGDILMHPTDFLNKIEQTEYFIVGDKTILVFINQKLAFVHNMNIKGSQIQNHSQILIRQENEENNLTTSRIRVHYDAKYSKEFTNALKRVSNNKFIPNKYRSQQFCKPFLYLTSQQYNKRIFERIRYFERHNSQLSEEQSVYSIIKDLYVNQHMLKSYYGICYLGVNNFRFSLFYEKYDTFYWYSFMTAYKSVNQVESSVAKNRGTVFIITSLNGKEISDFSLYPQNKQILFAPFTYFIVEKIQKQKDFDRVYLSQISSPISFQKNIVLWVDDVPTNNIGLIQKILKLLDIQILQVTSTIQAMKWVKQFGWLLNWKGIKFKLISDMARKQQDKQNYLAGVDLLQQLYKQDVITTSQTLIFCGNVEKAKQNISDRKIWKDKYFYVSSKEQQLIKFVMKDFKHDY